jgi:hypothetical protein
MPKPPRTQKDVANAFQQAVGTLREAWKSNEKISKARDATLKRYCLHAPGEPHAENHNWRVLTEEPYFQAPGDEERINITDSRFSIAHLIKKCPDFIEEFGSEPGRADEPRPAHPSSSDDNSTLLIKYMQKEVERLEDENNDLKQKNETLRIENAALQQQGQGAEERETDVGLEELRDKVLQRLKKEGEQLATALKTIRETDAELKGKLQQLHVKYNQDIGSLEKKPWKANGIKEILELWDMVAQLPQQFNVEIFQFKEQQLKEDNKDLSYAYQSVIGRGEKPLNHTMRALELDLGPQNVKDTRMQAYNYWVQRACDSCKITGNQLAKQLEEKYPEYNRFVNTLADFEVRFRAMRKDLAELNLHQCEKLVEELVSKDGWVGFLMPVHGLDYTFRLAYRFTKNETAPELQVRRTTRNAPGKRRKSGQPQSTDT